MQSCHRASPIHIHTLYVPRVAQVTTLKDVWLVHVPDVQEAVYMVNRWGPGVQPMKFIVCM